MKNEVIEKILEDRDMTVADLTKKYGFSYSSIYSLLSRYNIKPRVHQVHPKRPPRVKHPEPEREFEFTRPVAVYTNSRSPYGIADELHKSYA